MTCNIELPDSFNWFMTRGDDTGRHRKKALEVYKSIRIVGRSSLFCGQSESRQVVDFTLMRKAAISKRRGRSIGMNEDGHLEIGLCDSNASRPISNNRRNQTISTVKRHHLYSTGGTMSTVVTAGFVGQLVGEGSGGKRRWWSAYNKAWSGNNGLC